MATDLYVPPKTAAELHAAHPEGSRHQAMIKIAMALLGNNFSEAAVFAELRSKFDSEKTDKEIRDVIAWCSAKNPAPSGFGSPTHLKTRPTPLHVPARAIVVKRPTDANKLVEWFLNGNSTSVEQLMARSPTPLTGNGHDPLLAFEKLYDPTDHVNIVCKFTLSEKGKANPSGAGQTLVRDKWLDWFREKGIPKADAGAWLRMNPCKEIGTGKGGSIMDCDVTHHRYMLLESDTLSLSHQLSLYAALRLPIAAVITSGAKSVHAWVKIDSEDSDSYDATVLEILKALEPFGFDQSNKNPSRLSRLPGAIRNIGAVNGEQKILYLDPSPSVPFDSDTFALSLTSPLPDAKPFQRLMRNAHNRYEDLHINRGKLGVQVGIRDMDRDTGGFKKGQMTILAAGTNGGKSTTALNFINGALKNGHGVALFTLEMSEEEIVDWLVSMNCQVNRNGFNTGYFNDTDPERIKAESERLSHLPLWIYDDASMTVAQMAGKIHALAGKIECVVIDYIQIIEPEDSRISREQQVADIASSLRVLCKKVKLPFLVLSQLSDEGKLRESRVVGHAAHNVMVIEIDGKKAKLKITKGRGIPKKHYTLDYTPEYCRLESERFYDDDKH